MNAVLSIVSSVFRICAVPSRPVPSRPVPSRRLNTSTTAQLAALDVNMINRSFSAEVLLVWNSDGSVRIEQEVGRCGEEEDGSGMMGTPMLTCHIEYAGRSVV